MTKVTIFGRGLGPEEVEALQELVAATDASEAAIGVVQTVGEAQPDVDMAVVVVLGTPSACNDAGLEAELIKAQNTGQSIVWIWPEGSIETALPVTAKKYCYSVVP